MKEEFYTMDTQHSSQQRKANAIQNIKGYIVPCFGEHDCELKQLPQSGPHEMKRIADASGIDKTEMETIIQDVLTNYLTNQFKAYGSDTVGWRPIDQCWMQVAEMTRSLMQAIYPGRR